MPGGTWTIGHDRSAGGFETITVTNAAIGFTATEISKAGPLSRQECESVFVTVSLANIRFCIDGTTATTTVGHILTSGQNLTLHNASDIKNFSAFRDDSTDAELAVTFRF